MNHQPSTIPPPPSAIYVHIPFCVRKCLYCDFASYPGKEKLFGPYVEALRQEIRREAEGFPGARISTIYFGGGTPNVLSPQQLSSILEEIRRSFRVEADAEITTEANPGLGVGERARGRGGDCGLPSAVCGLSQVGFNRLSLGVQSLHDDELRRLGRIHSAEEAVEAFRAAREDGFENISIDLMYGIPGQTPESWELTLDRIAVAAPEHVSLYSLTVEKGTPFWDMCRAGRLELPGSDIEADMYEQAIRTLTDAGFVHYEISNFARPGFESRHNTTYWRNEPYFGFGAGAASYKGKVGSEKGKEEWWPYVRRTNVRSVEEYIRRIEREESAADEEEQLTVRGSMGETMFLGLRMLRGVDVDTFTRRYGVSPLDAFADEISALERRGLLEETVSPEHAVRLTHRGLLLANEVFAEFV